METVASPRPGWACVCRAQPCSPCQQAAAHRRDWGAPKHPPQCRLLWLDSAGVRATGHPQERRAVFWWPHSRCDSDSGTKPAVPPVPEPSLLSHGLPVTAAGAAAQTSSRQSPAPRLQHQGCPLQPLAGMSWGKERPSPWSGTVGRVVPGSGATLVLSSCRNWGRGVSAHCGPVALPAAAAEQCRELTCATSTSRP